MDPTHGAFLLVCFAALLTVGVPISVSVGLTALGALSLSMDFGTATTTVAQRLATGLDRFTLLAIPFFILSGQIMGRGGMARRLIDFASALVGGFRGGLLYVNVVAGMLFGAVSGSAAAAVSAVGGFMIPRLEAQGYRPALSTSVNVSSATTSLIIPPSNILIVYALASGGTSIAALFLAGYVPGILVGAVLMAVAAWLGRDVRATEATAFSWGLLARRFVDALPSLMLVVIVIGGITAGSFTATEAGAVAVLYSVVFTVAVYRELELRELPAVFAGAALTTSIVMLLVGTSMALSWVLAYEHVPQSILIAFAVLDGHPVLTLLVMNVLLLLVGTVVDMTPAVLILTPMLLPIAVSIGVDPVHFGIIMVLNLCIGLCTPPVGSVLFLGCAVSGTSIADASRGLLPFYTAMVVALLIVTFVPELSLWLPRWLLGG